MSQHSTTITTAPPPPRTLGLPPGQDLWLCLAPGSTLHTTQGEVVIRFSPCACGQTLQAPQHTLLKAGEHLPWNGQAQAAWVQLHNPRRGPAEVQLVEAAPAPGLRQKIWHGLRTAFKTPKKAAKDPGQRGALHAAR